MDAPDVAMRDAAEHQGRGPDAEPDEGEAAAKSASGLTHTDRTTQSDCSGPGQPPLQLAGLKRLCLAREQRLWEALRAVAGPAHSGDCTVLVLLEVAHCHSRMLLYAGSAPGAIGADTAATAQSMRGEGRKVRLHAVQH